MKVIISILVIFAPFLGFGQKAILGNLCFSSYLISPVNRMLKVYDRNDDYFKSKLFTSIGFGADLSYIKNKNRFSISYNYIDFYSRIRVRSSTPWFDTLTGIGDDKLLIKDRQFSGNSQSIGIGFEHKFYSIRRHSLSCSYLLRVRNISMGNLPYYPWRINGGIGIGIIDVDENGDTLGIVRSYQFKYKYSNDIKQLYIANSIGLTYRHGYVTNFHFSVFYNFSKPFGYGFYALPIYGENVGGKLKVSDQGFFVLTGVDFLLTSIKGRKEK